MLVFGSEQKQSLYRIKFLENTAAEPADTCNRQAYMIVVTKLLACAYALDPLKPNHLRTEAQSNPVLKVSAEKNFLNGIVVIIFLLLFLLVFVYDSHSLKHREL